MPQHPSGNALRIGAFAGITWAGVNVVGGFSGGTPPAIDAAGDTIRAYIADNQTPLLVSAAAFMATIPLLTVFVGSLVGRLRLEPDERSGTVATVAVVGLTVQLVALGLSYALLVPMALDESLGSAASADLLQYLYVATFVLALVGNIGGATTLLALGAIPISGLRSVVRRSATVIGTLTLAASAAGLVSSDVASVAVLAFVPYEVWVLLTGLSILRHHQPDAPSAPGEA